MRRVLTVLLLSLSVLAAPRAEAYTCANGVYRAGCVGPNGAVGVRKVYPGNYYRRGYNYSPQRYPPAAACARGPYRAGCSGPNGAVVVRRPY